LHRPILPCEPASLLQGGSVDADSTLGLVALVFERPCSDEDAKFAHRVEMGEMRGLKPAELVVVELEGAWAAPQQYERVPVEFHRATSYQATGM
jgi:hypothetical protein